MLKISKFKLYSDKTFGILISLYISSQIIFPLSSNIIISNLLNLILLSLILSFFILNKINVFKINYVIIAYLSISILAIFSLLWSIDFSHSSILVNSLIFNTINLFLLYNIIRYYNIHNYILYGILIGLFFNYLIAIDLINYVSEWTNNARFVGTMARSTALANVLIVGIFSSLILWNHFKSRYWNILLMISIILGFYTILLTVSKKAILIGFILLMTFLYFQITNKKNLFRLVISIPILLIIFFNTVDMNNILDKIEKVDNRYSEFSESVSSNGEGSTADRISFIMQGLEIISEHPILGTGLDTFILQEKTHHYSHNNYIELFVGMGLFSILIYYSIYIITIYRARYIIQKEKKILTILFILIMFLMDFTQSSYLNKLFLFMFLYISCFIETHQKGTYND